jgi:VWFA-related protein
MQQRSMRRFPAVLPVAAALAFAAVTGSTRSIGAQQAPQQAQSPQQPSPGTPPPVVFKVETSYVEVDAVAMDRQGNFVRGLNKEDFEVFEDGKPQKIDVFTSVDIPVVAQKAFLVGGRPATTDVKSNAPSVAGRLYVIVLDDLGTTALRTSYVVKSARQFVERHMAANDLAAVVYTSGRGDASQEFTGDRQLLVAAIDKFVGRKLLSLTLAKADQFYHQHSMELEANASSANDPENNGQPVSGTVRGPIGYPDVTTDPDDFERGYRAREVLRTLKSVAETLSGVRGRRKALLFFSEGIDYPIYDVFGSPSATDVVLATKDAITAAARSNVSFFTIDPRGLVGLSAEEIELSASTDPSRGFDAHGLIQEMRLSQDSLITLAEETGGFAAVNSRNDAPIFDRIVRANSSYYVLGYYPPENRRDGAFHKIDVRVKRPGLRVSARKGYAAPRGRTRDEIPAAERDRAARAGTPPAPQNSPKTSVELREILTSPLQQSGVTLSVQAAPFKNKPKEASVALAVEIDASRLRFEPAANGAFHDDLELSFFALDDKGKPHEATAYNLNLTLKPDTYERVKAQGLRVNPRIALAPGRYQLRIGAREAGAGELGSVFYDVDVPDFTKGGITMSGLLVTATSSRLLLTPEPDAAVPAGLLPGPATSRREFAPGDTLSAFAEIYDNTRDRREIQIVTTLLSETGTEAFKSTQSLGGDAQRNSRNNTYQYSTSIPLASLQPGRYLLRAEASPRGPASDTNRASRETLITIAAPK